MVGILEREGVVWGAVRHTSRAPHVPFLPPLVPFSIPTYLFPSIHQPTWPTCGVISTPTNSPLPRHTRLGDCDGVCATPPDLCMQHHHHYSQHLHHCSPSCSTLSRFGQPSGQLTAGNYPSRMWAMWWCSFFTQSNTPWKFRSPTWQYLPKRSLRRLLKR